MAKPDYKFRPSKAVQRRMIVDVCRRLSTFAPLSDYQYVGFGGLEFVDFDLMHRALGVTNMTSIESDTAGIERYKFNVPFKGIKVLGGYSEDQLTSIDWSPLSIVWLDYVSTLTHAVLDKDIALLCSRLQPGSALFVTLNAQPARKMEGRRAGLAVQVGEERIPSGVTDDSLALWGLADVQRTILTDSIRKGLRERPVQASWQQIINIHYADDAKMQTLGGVVVSAAMQRTIAHCGFEELGFARMEEDALTVRVPMLTQRERLHLERQIPLGQASELNSPGLPLNDKEDFLAVYRYEQSASSVV